MEEGNKERAQASPRLELAAGESSDPKSTPQTTLHHTLTLHFLKIRKCNQKSSLPEHLYWTGPSGTWPKSCPYLLPIRGDLFWSQPRPAGQGELCQPWWEGDVTSLTVVPPSLGPGSAQTVCDHSSSRAEIMHEGNAGSYEAEVGRQLHTEVW